MAARQQDHNGKPRSLNDPNRPPTRSQPVLPPLPGYKARDSPGSSSQVPRPPMSFVVNERFAQLRQTPVQIKAAGHPLRKTASSSSLKSDTAQSTSPQGEQSAAAPAAPHPKQALQEFRSEWSKGLYEGHPNRQTGLDIIDYLIADPRVSVSANSRYAYQHGGDPRLAPDLARLIQIDLDQINLEQTVILDEQGSRVPLNDATAVRMAVSMGAPVAFSLPCSTHGVCAQPLLQLGPGHVVDKFSRTAFGVSGTLFVEAPTIQPSVLTQAVGQCVIIHWAHVPENSAGPPGGVTDRRGLVGWALNQPYVAIHVLRPGEQLFLPPHRTRFTIALGRHNSTFSATTCARILHTEANSAHWASSGHRPARLPPAPMNVNTDDARSLKRTRFDK